MRSSPSPWIQRARAPTAHRPPGWARPASPSDRGLSRGAASGVAPGAAPAIEAECGRADPGRLRMAFAAVAWRSQQKSGFASLPQTPADRARAGQIAAAEVWNARAARARLTSKRRRCAADALICADTGNGQTPPAHSTASARRSLLLRCRRGQRCGRRCWCCCSARRTKAARGPALRQAGPSQSAAPPGVSGWRLERGSPGAGVSQYTPKRCCPISANGAVRNP